MLQILQFKSYNLKFILKHQIVRMEMLEQKLKNAKNDKLCLYMCIQYSIYIYNTENQYTIPLYLLQLIYKKGMFIE